MILKQCAQQIGLSASANASDNLDLTAPLIGEQLVKISVCLISIKRSSMLKISAHNGSDFQRVMQFGG